MVSRSNNNLQIPNKKHKGKRENGEKPKQTMLNSTDNNEKPDYSSIEKSTKQPSRKTKEKKCTFEDLQAEVEVFINENPDLVKDRQNVTCIKVDDDNVKIVVDNECDTTADIIIRDLRKHLETTFGCALNIENDISESE